jgi:hypothetical protein
MVQSPSWKANWFAASQEIPRIFMEPEVSLPHSQASAQKATKESYTKLRRFHLQFYNISSLHVI